MVSFNDFKTFFELIGVSFISGVVVLLIGIVVARIVSKLLSKLLKEVELNNFLKKEFNVKFDLEKLLCKIVVYIIYFIAIVMALGQLGITTMGFYIILLIILSLVVVFLVLATKDFIPNITAGYFLRQKNILKKGDKISLSNVKGKIFKIGFIETEIKTNKEIVMIPNSVLVKEVVKKSD